MDKDCLIGKRTSDGYPNCIEPGIRNGLEIRKSDPVVPMILENPRSGVWMVFTQGPFIDSSVPWEGLKD